MPEIALKIPARLTILGIVLLTLAAAGTVLVVPLSGSDGTPTSPNDPVGSLTLTAKTHDSISVEWPPVQTATGYQVRYWETHNKHQTKTHVEVSENRYTATGLKQNTEYTIRVLFIQNGSAVRQDKASPPLLVATDASPPPQDAPPTPTPTAIPPPSPTPTVTAGDLGPADLDGPGLGEGPERPYSLTDLLDDEGKFQWHDGDRAIRATLLKSPSASEQAILDALSGVAATAYVPPSGNDTNSASNPPQAVNWFVSDTGQKMLLVGGVIVEFNASENSHSIAATWQRNGIKAGRVSAVAELPNLYLVKTVSDAETLHLLKALSSEPGVASVSPNWYVPHATHDSDRQAMNRLAKTRCTKYTKWLSDAYSSCLWHLDASTDYRFPRGSLLVDPVADINISDVWKTTMGAGVTVRVSDDGWEATHEDLVGNADTNRSLNLDGKNGEGASWHGTAVAGVIAARDNKVGGRGVAPRATMVNVDYLDSQSLLNNIKALSHREGSVAVSNHSYGPEIGNGLSHFFNGQRRAIESGLLRGFGGKGTSYVFSGGNYGARGDYPGAGWTAREEEHNHRGVITVCAVDFSGKRTPYSNSGPNLWVCAPSSGGYSNIPAILAPIGKNLYTDRFGGTSAAAPMVSGVVALMRSVNPNLTWRDVKVILANTAQKIDVGTTAHPNLQWITGALKYGEASERYSYHYDYGFGLVDAKAAVTAAQGWTLLPAMKTSTAESSLGLGINLPAAGTGTTLSLNLASDIDFIEHVAVTFRATATDIRKFRISVISPQGTETLLLPQFTGCKANTCGLYGSFNLGTVRHLGESASGAWKLKVHNHSDPASPVLGQLLSWSVVVHGHKSATTPTNTATQTPANASTQTPTVSVTAHPLKINEGQSTTLTFRATPAPTKPLTVNTFIEGSNGLGVPHRSSVTIPTSGALSLVIPTRNDTHQLGDGRITAFLKEGAGYAVGEPRVATATVTDDDEPLPVVTISAKGSVTEGEDATFTLVADDPKPKETLAVSINVYQRHGNAVAAEDLGERVISVPPSGSADFTVSTTDDRVDEPEVHVEATIVGSPDRYHTTAQVTAIVTVLDNDEESTTGITFYDSETLNVDEPFTADALTEAVTKLTAVEVTQTSAKLVWPEIADADTYILAWYASDDSSKYQEHTTTQTSHALTGLERDTGYSAILYAMSNHEFVGSAQTVGFTTQAALPPTLGDIFVVSLNDARTRTASQQPGGTTSVVYVIDDSGSMDRGWQDVRGALEQVRDLSGVSNTKVALVAFGSKATGSTTETLFPLTAHSSAPWDTPLTGSTLTPITSFGGYRGHQAYMDFEAAIRAAISLLSADTATTKKLVFVTDSRTYKHSATLAGDLGKASIVVDTIFFDPDVHWANAAMDALRKTAAGTGGAFTQVIKPSGGADNSPAVPPRALSAILKEKAAANTSTLYLLDNSTSVHPGDRIHDRAMESAMRAVQTKARGIPTSRVGTARFLGANGITGKITYYRVINGSLHRVSGGAGEVFGPYHMTAGFTAGGSFQVPHFLLRNWTGSTDIDNALASAYGHISEETSATRRVVLVTDGITHTRPTAATLRKYTDANVCIDVVAIGDHADRVYLKSLADTTGLCGDFNVAAKPD